MRVALVGVSHWHTLFYLGTLMSLKDVEIVGAADPDRAHAQDVATIAGCPVFVDYKEMCARLKPDFVLALGKHSEMADEVRFFIAQRIPFAIEKPAAMTIADADDIAMRAKAAGIFAAVPLVVRYSKVRDFIREQAPGEVITYMDFSFIGRDWEFFGAPRDRWKRNYADAGGGALLGVGVHVIDQCRYLMPEGTRFEVVGAMMSNNVEGLDVEDHGAVFMRAGDVPCVVQAGYLCPGPFQLRYTICTEKHYFIGGPDYQTIEIIKRDGKEVRPIPIFERPGLFYPTFIEDTIRRFKKGEKPIADLSDMAEVVRIIRTAYDMAPLPAAR